MVYNLGTDFKSDWSFENGDLTLVSDDQNLKQSIQNRLTCFDGVFTHFYHDYGTVISTYLGFKRDKTTLEFMRIELEKVLSQDPRMQDFKLELEYVPEGLRVDLTINLDGTDVDMNFITDGERIKEIGDKDNYASE